MRTRAVWDLGIPATSTALLGFRGMNFATACVAENPEESYSVWGLATLAVDKLFWVLEARVPLLYTMSG